MTVTYLTKTRLEAIVYALGQALAGASEIDVSRAELEAARAWAESALAARQQGKSWVGGSGRSRRTAPPNAFEAADAAEADLDRALDAVAGAMAAP